MSFLVALCTVAYGTHTYTPRTHAPNIHTHARARTVPPCRRVHTRTCALLLLPRLNSLVACSALLQHLRSKRLPASNPKCAIKITQTGAAVPAVVQLHWQDKTSCAVVLHNRTLSDALEEWSWREAEKKGQGLGMIKQVAVDME